MAQGKDFALSYVGRMKEKFNPEFNKFSVHYDKGKEKNYCGDDRVVHNKTFLVKMNEKCKFDPNFTFAVDDPNDPTAEYRKKLKARVEARAVYEGNYERMFDYMEHERERVTYMRSEKGM